MPGYIYLASPYSHPDPAVREMRYVVVRDIASRLILDRREPCFSPIAHGHDMTTAGKADYHYDAWKHQDEAMIAGAQELWVVMMPGWDRSAGIASELAFAASLGKPVKYMEPETGNLFNGPPLAAKALLMDEPVPAEGLNPESE